MYWKPIISMYWSFCTRKIIYQNWFGRRKERDVYRDFDDPFPIPTDSIDYKTYKHILSGGEYERVGTIVFSK